MPQCTIIRVEGWLGVYSWTTGLKETPAPKPRTEDDILLMLLRLEKLGKVEEADELLQRYCR